MTMGGRVNFIRHIRASHHPFQVARILVAPITQKRTHQTPRSISSYPILNFNITKNGGLEKVTPLKSGDFGYPC